MKVTSKIVTEYTVSLDSGTVKITDNQVSNTHKRAIEASLEQKAPKRFKSENQIAVQIEAETREAERLGNGNSQTSNNGGSVVASQAASPAAQAQASFDPRAFALGGAAATPCGRRPSHSGSPPLINHTDEVPIHVILDEEVAQFQGKIEALVVGLCKRDHNVSDPRGLTGQEKGIPAASKHKKLDAASKFLVRIRRGGGYRIEEGRWGGWVV